MQKFVEVSDNIGPQNDWYIKCQREQIPCVIVEKRKKYATVRWEHNSLPPSMDILVAASHEKYLDDLTGIFNRYCNAKSRDRSSGRPVEFVDLEIDKARLAANELYDVAVKIIASAG
jgi:hypothetical protein